MNTQSKPRGILLALVVTIVWGGLTACSSTPSQRADVQGSEVCLETATKASFDYSFDCTVTMSDDRVSGSATFDGNTGSDGTYYGVATLTNKNGSWSGVFSGLDNPDGSTSGDYLFYGSGGYNGWTFKEHVEFSDFNDMTLTGTIEPPTT